MGVYVNTAAKPNDKFFILQSDDSMMSFAEKVLDSDLDVNKAKSYRNALAATLVVTFLISSYHYWTRGSVRVETTLILFSAGVVFLISQYVYARN